MTRRYVTLTEREASMVLSNDDHILHLSPPLPWAKASELHDLWFETCSWGRDDDLARCIYVPPQRRMRRAR